MTDLPADIRGNTELIAAVDLGSNSFHLVIARIVDGTLQLLHREKQKVQLADGLDSEMRLSTEAMQRGLTVLAQFADTLRALPPTSVRVIATYTLRRAQNSSEFLRLAQQVFPLPIEVISGQEEARLIYQGVAHFETFPGQRLVIDIGGGSTEFAIGQDFQPLRLASRNMGCVNYAKHFFPKGRISAKRFERAVLQAEQELENIVNGYKSTGWQQVVGTSGTIKTIQDIIAALGWHPHHIELTHLLQLKQILLNFENADQLDIAGLTEERKSLLGPGLAILLASFQMLGITQMVYVDAALREGVLYEMSDRLQHQDIRSHTIQSLVKRYTVDTAQAQRVQQTVQLLFQQVQSSWLLDEFWLQLLGFAANVVEIGLQINSSSVQRHSAYILNNTNLPGFNQEQQRLLACLIRFHRRKIKVEDIPDFYLFSAEQFCYALVIFRLAILFNQKRRDESLAELNLVATPNSLTIELPESWYQQHSVLAADLATEQQYLKKLNLQLICPGLQQDSHDDLS